MGFTLKFCKKASLVAGLCLCCLCLSTHAEPKKDTDKQLKEVQQELKKRQEGLKKRQQKQQQAQNLLRTTELKLAKQAKALHQTQSAIRQNQTQQQELTEQLSQLQVDQKAQQKVLAAQLESHFMAGSSDYLQMLLNQKDPAQIERVLSYFEYLNQARIKALTALQKTEEELEQVEEALLAKHNQLQELQTNQSREQQQLKGQQQEHQQLVARLAKQLKDDQTDIELLQSSEQQLKELMDQHAQRAAVLTLSGLEKGLSWPVNGRLRHKYNSIRKGQIRWKGVLMDSPLGSDVRAIANGRVLFADWVKGMGLVMVLDHGDEYLSIYGHTQTLLRQAGDEVREGDTIALVGKSGGQTQASLYFEIRHEGHPVNPSHWCR